MKIIVDKVPTKPKDCSFGKCGFSGYYCRLRNDYLCSLHTLNRCDELIGLDKLVSIELLPSPAYLPTEWIEHEIRIKGEVNEQESSIDI